LFYVRRSIDRAVADAHGFVVASTPVGPRGALRGDAFVFLTDTDLLFFVRIVSSSHVTRPAPVGSTLGAFGAVASKHAGAAWFAPRFAAVLIRGAMVVFFAVDADVVEAVTAAMRIARALITVSFSTAAALGFPRGAPSAVDFPLAHTLAAEAPGGEALVVAAARGLVCLSCHAFVVCAVLVRSTMVCLGTLPA